MVFKGEPLGNCKATLAENSEQVEDPVMCILLYCVNSVAVYLIFFETFRNGIKPSRVQRLFSPAMNVVTYPNVVVTLQQPSKFST